jgi:hypothetical protein
MKKPKPAPGTWKRTRTRPETSQSDERSTITQSVSFDWQIYELMEREREEISKSGARGPFEFPRSAYIREILAAHFRAKGWLK